MNSIPDSADANSLPVENVVPHIEPIVPAEDPAEKLKSVLSRLAGGNVSRKEKVEKMKSLKNSTDMEAILYRLNMLEGNAREVERLQRKVKELEKAASIGEEIAEEIKEEVLEERKRQEIIEDTNFLEENDVSIPFVEEQKLDFVFKEKQKQRKMKKKLQPLTERQITEAYKQSASAMKAAKRLGVSYPTFKKYAVQYNLFKTKPKATKRPDRTPINPFKGKYPINKILEGAFPNFPVHRIKDKLIRSGIKHLECEQCGYKERRITDGKIPLLLNFEDGDNKNHHLENLRIFCYNCTFISGKGYVKKGTVHNNLDPDVMQGAKFPLKARF